MTTYTTVSGDMFDSIAYKLYGDGRYTDLLINANQDYHALYIFPAGVVLTVPPMPEKNTVPDLPPWKKAK